MDVAGKTEEEFRELDELIHAKVAPPVWMGNQIRRDELLARLDGALQRRLTLIHAPAGYGKTSLLSQWRSRFDAGSVLVAWITLERDDSDAAADKRVMDRVRASLVRGHAMNQSQSQDLLPGL